MSRKCICISFFLLFLVLSIIYAGIVSATTTLTINSLNPDSGQGIAYRQKGDTSWRGGATPYSGSFSNDTQLEIVVPFVAYSTGRNIFSSINGCDTVSYWSGDLALSNSIVCSVTMNLNKTISVDYSSVTTVSPPLTPDIFWQNHSTGQVMAWSMNGTTVTEETSVTTMPSGWRVVGTGDINGDGNADIVSFNDETGDIYIEYVNGGTVLGGQTGGKVSGAEWKIVALADIDGDGIPDYVWHNQVHGQLYIWYIGFDDWHGLIVKGGSATNHSGAPFFIDPTVWSVAGTGTLNGGDECPDILLQNKHTGDLSILSMAGELLLYSFSLEGMGDPSWKAVGVGDFDKNGTPDIIWRNQLTGANEVWFMNSSGSSAFMTGSTPLTPIIDTRWEIVGPK